jgi:hypothetical protein
MFGDRVMIGDGQLYPTVVSGCFGGIGGTFGLVRCLEIQKEKTCRYLGGDTKGRVLDVKAAHYEAM